MKKILISACLLGKKVRYDGKDSFCSHPILQQWKSDDRLILVCPEMEGGLPTPRPASELQGPGGGIAVLQGKAEVSNIEGKKTTDAYLRGAEKTLALAHKHQIVMAILKARSPSCGNEFIYDGSFQQETIPGMGVTAALLIQNDFKVFNEEQLEEAIAYFQHQQ